MRLVSGNIINNLSRRYYFYNNNNTNDKPNQEITKWNTYKHEKQINEDTYDRND